jgi:hypothetical protein
MASGRDQEHHEGSEAARRFEQNLTRLLKTSKEELIKREAMYKKQKHNKPKARR